MSSSFSWLDYSDQDRQKTMDIIELFRESDTRDELGIGRVRDTFSDLLFPGTSTLQTRAKYFLFVPWIYFSLEEREVSSARIDDRARREEVKLIHTLLDNADTEGVIGAVSKGDLMRMPSSIYWQGLEVWGIRMFSGSRRQYYRFLDTYYRSKSFQQKDEDGNLISKGRRPNWHPGLPPMPEDFPDQASLQLTYEEASYLQERLLTNVGQTLLTYLVDQGETIPESTFPWRIPQTKNLPQPLQTWLKHARNFSELIWGAPLLYNLMLAELEESQELIERYRQMIREWSALLNRRESVFREWDRNEFWDIIYREYGKPPIPTRRFIDAWWDIALQTPDEVANSDQARELIRDRERSLKKGQARLFSQRAREMWGGSAGTAQLDYRWENGVRQIIVDIIQGLKGS